MNKYTASALSAEAASGLRVLVVSHSRRAELDAFGEFEALAESAGASRVRRANGAERIEFPSGGFLAFASARARAGRGICVDLVFVDWDVETELSPSERATFYEDVSPYLATSARHELVRA